MNSHRNRLDRDHHASIGEPTFVALEILYRAYRYAVDTGNDLWDFAVDIDELRDAGLSKSEFRWLLAHGYAEHAEEVTLPSSPSRQFNSLRSHQITDSTCFVLAELGVQFVEGVCCALDCGNSNEYSGESALTSEGAAQGPDRSMPVWDRKGKRLSIGGVVIKEFRWPAPNQELLLDVFEEEEWPHRIDDPLPRVPDQDPRQRLRDTIKCLNRSQQNALILFHGDGSGEGITWELTGNDGHRTEDRVRRTDRSSCTVVGSVPEADRPTRPDRHPKSHS